MRYFSIAFIFLVLIPDWSTKAQNLVPNPGFEFYNSCPKALANVRDVLNWFPATAGTPDYFNRCDAMGFSRFIQPHSGDGCLGLIVLNGYEEFAEYIQVTLTDTLKAETEYCVQFYVKSDNKTVEIDQLGLAFIDNPIQKDFITRLTLKPDLVSPRGEIISSYLNWHRVGGVYRAKGGESAIILGSFNAPELLTVVPIEGGARSQAWNCYYLFDDVAVFERLPNVSCEVEWRPPIAAVETATHTQTTTTDSMFLPQVSPIYFDSDKYNLDTSDSVLIKNVAAVLQQNPAYTLELAGHTDSNASEGYNISLAAKRCEAVQILLVYYQIASNRITLNALGEKSPVFDNTTAENRAANRRVEFIFR